MERNRGPLGLAQTEAVLRRAAELDREHAPVVGSVLHRAELEPKLDAADLERIAAESGLSVEAVRRALTELQSGVLDRPVEEPRGVERLAVGEETLARRTFTAPPAEVEARLSSTLRKRGLQPVRRAEHGTRWEPAQGLHHTLGRMVNLGGTGVWVGSSVESAVYAVPGQRTTAELRGNARDLMAPIATLAGLLLAAPAAIAVLVVLALALRWGFTAGNAVALLAIAAAWAGLTWAIARGAAKKRVRKLRNGLERMLEELADSLALQGDSTLH